MNLTVSQQHNNLHDSYRSIIIYNNFGYGTQLYGQSQQWAREQVYAVQAVMNRILDKLYQNKSTVKQY